MANANQNQRRLKTQDELKIDLERQLRFLKNSCKLFDDGELDESIRMSTAIRILVYDTGKSTSLLKQLGVKNQLKFIDTAEEFEESSWYPMGFTGLTYTDSYISAQGIEVFGFKARLDFEGTSTTASFDDWWASNVVIQDSHKSTFTRAALVTTVANQDGGAHIDPSIDENYAKLSRDHSIGWQVSVNGVFIKIPDLVLHSIRQIAFEIITTLETQILN
ncbi:hypothetical protein [Siphonobacter sp.]|uniref:hypothetical protein n=1 Tax=Siphonobacter sp. TaxID=1869184 RepID=UPI003B3A99C4